ncbi:MAG TPA: exodeoxyribonuclease V subunit gamma, partial [Ramlibacter sp.]|nr:exodeoxyribonuclease V subunit gamma [Ramlibacter sp.]
MNESEQSLPPGFMVVHGNHPEALRDLMVAWMQRHPVAPLEDELVLVQSNGVAQWLKLSLAADPAQGGIGVAAALRTQLPAHALWEAYRAVLGPDTVPRDSALDESRLVWRLMRLLPALLAEPEFAPLRGFLHDDADGRKLHQLALRVSDLLDQYQVYRADWLARWAQGDPVLTLAHAAREVPVPDTLRWQPRLW